MNSENSIIKKLNLLKHPTKLLLNKPEDIKEFDGLEFDTELKQSKYDLIFIFVFTLEQMSHYLQMIIDTQALNDNGYVYFAYPKKNNPKYKEYIDRDSIFPHLSVDNDGYALNSQIKFARMVSLDDVFTVVGLKAQTKKLKKSDSTKSSQCVDDYIDNIADIQRYLDNDPAVLEVYNKLTPGYQKDWARYVYSAKRSETQEKRLLEMKDVIVQGYKTMDLYRRKQK